MERKRTGKFVKPKRTMDYIKQPFQHFSAAMLVQFSEYTNFFFKPLLLFFVNYC